jgi:glycosyltransferase involved in cell wall biosynthesis
MDREKGPLWIQTEEDGIHVHWVRVPYSNYMTYRERIRAFAEFAWLAAGKAAHLGGDVVFATSTPLTIALPAIYVSRLRRIPMVLEVRDLWPEIPIAIGALHNPVSKALARALEWLAYHASVYIIALSPGMAEGIMRRGIPSDRVTIIPNGCDVELFDVPYSQGQRIRMQLGILDDQPLIVYTGAFGLINGVGYLVEVAAAARSAAPDMRFILVGSGAESDQVSSKAETLGVLGKNLWIWEPIPKYEIPDLLAAATIATSVVIPLKPLWHNSANKFFDALAAGRPIAINHGGWQADLLEETGAGIVLPPEDPARAAQILASFVSDPERLRSAGEAARKLAHERFHRDDLARQLEDVLSGAAGQGK